MTSDVRDPLCSAGDREVEQGRYLHGSIEPILDPAPVYMGPNTAAAPEAVPSLRPDSSS